MLVLLHSNLGGSTHNYQKSLRETLVISDSKFLMPSLSIKLKRTRVQEASFLHFKMLTQASSRNRLRHVEQFFI